ncbi:sigma factor-like helix-turn-helix DNA-binding protein [Microbacterium hydrocarbonoxydans]|uniref:sigma factor-like helix-turn-helix DNA-binding protein n=1 Tax=Microbacterium hydrocarbonoxydans TaxID=273678 RepID=UPI00203BB4DE|nr:sigma factor-like helix-turn-helix DNA-binding protein [Microbacterium hydrocarbonoxydans]MCM3779858.1 hypothetical protein [Microbacterium hydrocarbonoxydans]
MLTRDDPLISEYLPVVRGHIVKNYAWMADRGNCLMSIDDLKQVAAIALVKLVGRWDDVLAEQGKSREGNGGLFWWYLKEDVKRTVSKYYRDIAHKGEYDEPTTDELGEETWEVQRTSLRTPTDAPGSRITREDIVDFFTTLSPRHKTLIALRYFDELPFVDVADVMSAVPGTVRNITQTGLKNLRAFARNQFLDDPAPMPRQVHMPWEPPESLVTYLRERHQKDLPEYLGIVTLAFRADVSYLVDMLHEGRHEVPGSKQLTMSPFQQAAADELLSQGESMREVSRRLDVSYGIIVHHAKRRRSAA